MDCQEFEDIAGAYALGAASETEQREVQEHLATCASCRQLLRELQTATDLLPLAVPAVQPSPQLKKRIMDLVTADAARHEALKRARQPERRYSWWHYWQTQVALAFVLLLLLVSGSLVAWNVTLHQQLAGIATTQNITYSIQGTQQAAGVRGKAVYLPQQHVTLVTIDNLPPLQGNEVYQGWTITQNHPQSLGLLQIQNGTATLSIPNDIRSADAIAISREPGPQASPGVPRGQIVATGSLHPQHEQRGARENPTLITGQRVRNIGV